QYFTEAFQIQEKSCCHEHKHEQSRLALQQFDAKAVEHKSEEKRKDGIFGGACEAGVSYRHACGAQQVVKRPQNRACHCGVGGKRDFCGCSQKHVIVHLESLVQ